jgi:hypothetical protein
VLRTRLAFFIFTKKTNHLRDTHMNNTPKKSRLALFLKCAFLFVFLTLSISTLARGHDRYKSMAGREDVLVLSTLFYFVPTLILMCPLIRNISSKRCEKIKLDGFLHYRVRMFLNGYVFSLFIFSFIYLLASLLCGFLYSPIYRNSFTYCHAAAIVLFVPVFFAAIDIPFTTKLKDVDEK